MSSGLLAYIVRRAVLGLFVIMGAVFVVTVVLHYTPGDPARVLLGEMATEEALTALRHELGLDKPLLMQYFNYLERLAHGDLGRSFRSGRRVTEEISSAYFPSLKLAGTGLAIGLIIGITAGVLAALHRGSWIDMTLVTLSTMGLSFPVFVTGLLLIFLFSYRLGWFPTGGDEGFSSLILPSLTLGLWGAGSLARFCRSSMLEVLQADYIRTARSKGLSEHVVTFRHALRNALLPVITVSGLLVGMLLGGSIITETVFAWPGLGRLLLTAVSKRDIVLVQGIVLVYAVFIVAINLLVDLLYGIVDPRIRHD